MLGNGKQNFKTLNAGNFHFNEILRPKEHLKDLALWVNVLHLCCDKIISNFQTVMCNHGQQSQHH